MNKTIQFYDENANDFISSTLNANLIEIQNMFLSYLPKGGTILDFGCGSGRDAKYFIDKGYNVTAIDGSEKLCKLAKEYLGIDVRCMLFSELDDVEKYDELWNLMPMDSSLNSSKSNKLPKWEPFFERFAKNQLIMYQMLHNEDMPEVRKRYESCFRDNLHSIWANQELYRKGNSGQEFTNILEKNMHPVYDSARRQGYQIWTQ